MRDTNFFHDFRSIGFATTMVRYGQEAIDFSILPLGTEYVGILLEYAAYVG